MVWAHMTPARTTRLVALSAALVLGVGAAYVGGEPTPAPVPRVAEVVPQAKFKVAVNGWRAARAQVRGLRATLRHEPDFRVSLQLAALAYGQDWRALERCALTEGYGESRRHHRENLVPSADGYGSIGPFQFLVGTFAGTPQGRAGLSRARQDVQAFAAAWMWSQGRRNEWYGRGC